MGSSGRSTSRLSEGCSSEQRLDPQGECGVHPETEERYCRQEGTGGEMSHTGVPEQKAAHKTPGVRGGNGKTWSAADLSCSPGTPSYRPAKWGSWLGSSETGVFGPGARSLPTV